MISTLRFFLRGVAPLALLAAVAGPAVLRADTITVGEAGTKGLDREGTVLRIENGELIYRTQTNDAHQPLAKVIKLNVASEAALTAAEQAYVEQKWADAAANYQKALSGSQKDWVKDRAVARLVEVAPKADLYPAAVAAYIEMLRRDPTNAKRPAVPADKADQLKAAIPEAVRAMSDTRLKEGQRNSVRDLLVEMYLAVGDTKSAEQILPKGAVAGAPRTGADATAGAASGQGRLFTNQAKIAYAGKDYAKAIDVIEKNRAAFSDPEDQFDVLYILADSKNSVAKTIPELQDAALGYMRLVAHFGGKSADPRVGDALLKTAIIDERVNQKAEALQLFRQIVGDAKFKGTPAAAGAAQGIDRLSKPAKAG